MPQPSTMKFVADLVIERVLAELKPGDDLAEVLQKAYPFENSKQGRQIWLDALLRHAADQRIDFSDDSFQWDEEGINAGASTPTNRRHPAA
jgi:hypothetical protein